MSFRWIPLSRRAGEPRQATATTAGRSHTARRRAALEWLEDRTLLSTSLPLSSLTWTAIGPASLQQGGVLFSGRIAGVAGDPNDSNVLYIAAAGGGVWKTTDAGASWKPLTDDQKIEPMGAISVSKSNPQVIYAGTGEANNSGDSQAGDGVLKSTNGGATWNLVGANVFNRKTISQIAISPTDPNTVYVSVAAFGANGLGGGTGVWKSTDGGANWTNTTAAISTNAAWSGVVMDQANPLNLFAAAGTTFGDNSNGVYKTTDGGANWAPAGNFPVGNANGRISLAISASNPKEVVALVANPTTGGLLYLQKTIDAGATWINQASTPDLFTEAAANIHQGWYDNTVSISPTDPNVIFAGGVSNFSANGIIESRDGGLTWIDLTVDSRGVRPHTDQHAQGFDAAGHLLIGNDGGIWRLDNDLPGQTAWANLNHNIQTTQFTGASLDPTNADVVYGGSQDNGTEKFTDNVVWREVFGGDGGYTAVDPSNTSTVYAERAGLSLYRSDSGGAPGSFQPVTAGIGTENGRFYRPYTIDPSNPNHLLYGTDRLYSTTNRGNSWTALFAPGSNGWTSTATVAWVTISASDPKTVYASTDDGKIFVSADGGSNWVEHDVAGNSDPISQIVVDPADPKTAYAVRGGYDGFGATGHVFKTSDGGATWVNLSGNLPDLPADSFAIDTRPGKKRMYVGTLGGVFASADGGATWSRFKTGMPDAEVTTLELNTTLNVLMAATHGRGVYEIKAIDAVSVFPTAPSPTEGVQFSGRVATFNDSPKLQPVSAYTVLIDWGDGTPATAGTVIDLGNGFYGVDGTHTYAEETPAKPYTLTINVTSTGGSNGQGSVALTVKDAPLTAAGLAISTTEGVAFSGSLGSFTDGNALAPLSDFTASIDWGDGIVSPGKITALGGGRFDVSGTHTYVDATAAGSPHAVSVAVSDVGGQTTAIADTAAVADATLVGTPVSISSVAGGTFSGTVASFKDPAPGDTIADYRVSINWGDGTPPTTLNSVPPATISNRGTRYDVQATHSFAKFNKNSVVTVTITDEGGGSITVLSKAVVADAAITAFPGVVGGTEGQSFSGQVATFTSGNKAALATDFSASTIDWGDGSGTQAAVITGLGAGKFKVTGSHTYAEETLPLRPNTVTVNIVSAGGSTASVTDSAVVTDAALSVAGVDQGAVAGKTVSGLVATFTDNYTLAPLSDYSATVDWGDGTVTTGTITAGAAGQPNTVSVSGGSAHAYARAQNYPITVTVKDVGGATAASTAQAVISDAPLTVTASTDVGSLTEGGQFTGSLGKVVIDNPLARPADYLISVDWGDGTASDGRLAATNVAGTFDVTPVAPHVYSEEGVYTVKLLVISLGGNRGSAQTTVTVNDGTIVGVSGQPIQAVAGAAFNGVVGSFTEYAKAPVSDFAARIDWGDGNVSQGVVTANRDGTFSVSGGNLYTAAGTYTPTISVNDVGGGAGSFAVGVTVSDPPISSVSNPISTVQGQPFSGVLASFTDPNVYAQAGSFTASVDWGDGTPATAGVVDGASGAFTVSGTHTYNKAGAAFPVTVTIASSGGSTTSSSSTAHVLVPLFGAMSHASDSGVSNTDGITNVTAPVFAGRAEPTSVIKLYAVPSADASAVSLVGSAVADAAGNWSVQISPLGTGSFLIMASMTDPSTNQVVQKAVLPGGSTNTPVTIETTGPTVASVSFDPRNGQLHVVYQTSLASIYVPGMVNANNYTFGLPSGAGIAPFAATGVSAAPGSNGQVSVTIRYNLGKSASAGGYVVDIHSAGIIDLAGNILNEQRFVTFPQSNNSPNPDYIAQIDVSRSLVASAPHLYVSLPEQIAANNFAASANSRKVVRVPKLPMPRVHAAVVPRPSTVHRRR